VKDFVAIDPFIQTLLKYVVQCDITNHHLRAIFHGR